MDNVSDVNEAYEILSARYGDENIKMLGRDDVVNVPSISTGVFGLDRAIGVGGLPKGRITEIFGPEASGKTSLSLQVIGKAQKKGGMAAFVDAEHALDPKYAEKLGVNMEDLLLSQPDYGEQALEIAESLVEMKMDVVVVDSVAALVPKAELDGEMEDQQIGLQARMMSKAMRKLTAKVKRSGTVFIFINQTRSKIGVMWGSPETTSGGNALKFYASLRIKVNRIKSVKASDKVVGARMKARVVKNKVAAPFNEAEYEIDFDYGVNNYKSIAEMGIELGVIKKSGSSYTFGKKSVRGLDNFAEMLSERKKTRVKLIKAIRKG